MNTTGNYYNRVGVVLNRLFVVDKDGHRNRIKGSRDLVWLRYYGFVYSILLRIVCSPRTEGIPTAFTILFLSHLFQS